MFKGNKIYAKLPLGWIKGFDSGIVIPKKMRYLTKEKEDSICVESG